MEMRNIISEVLKRPSMYVHPVSYDTLSAFICGCDMAMGLLDGFREWLVVRVNGRNNSFWPDLVLFLTFPDVEHPRELLRNEEKNKQAVESLKTILEEYWKYRSVSYGMRRIFKEYEDWLRRQKWYSPNLHGWSEEDGITLDDDLLKDEPSCSEKPNQNS